MRALLTGIAVLLAVIVLALSALAQGPAQTMPIPWTGNGSQNGFSALLGGIKLLQIGDSPTAPDDDASYLFIASLSAQTFTFEQPAPIAVTTVIHHVRMWARCRVEIAILPVSIAARLRVNGTNQTTSATVINSTSYQNLSWTWTTNPATGVAWTPADINGLSATALEEGGLVTSSILGVLRITSLSLEVEQDMATRMPRFAVPGV